MQEKAKSMQTIREEWKAIGYTTQSYRVHDGDKGMLMAVSHLLSAARIDKVLSGATLEDPLDWAFTLANRNAVKQNTNLSEVALWADNNPKMAKEMAATLEKAKTLIMDIALSTKKIENNKAFIESQGMDTDKYDELVMESARRFSLQLKAKAYYLMLLNGKTIEVKDV